MDNLRRISGFAVAFLMLTAVSAAALKPTSGGVRLLKPAETAMIRGGGGLPSGSSVLKPGIGGGGGYSPPPPIILNNVPYVTQYINSDPRSDSFCGIASALMVRAKNAIGASAPTLFYTYQQANASNIDSDLQTIDRNLRVGSYGGAYKIVDVAQNQGLLYIGNESVNDQYSITENILKDVYTGTVGRGTPPIHDIAIDNGHVNSVTMGPFSGIVGVANSATQAIWDHINTYKEPVVVVVDSNKQLSNGNVVSYLPASSIPTLHYIVIRGTEEDSSGTRYFSVYDPANRSLFPIKYTEADLRFLMELPSNTQPQWVYQYGISQVIYPVYILKVQGK